MARPLALALAAALSAGAALGALSCSSLIGIEDRSLDEGIAGADGGLNCATYCSNMKAGCTGSLEQYKSDDTCLGICGHLDPGTAGNPTGDTLSCRFAAAKLAVSSGEPDSYCSVAGPYGSVGGHIGPNDCGTPCDSYCSLMQAVCPTQFASDFNGKILDCKAKCQALSDPGPFDDSQQSGGSIQCRFYHVSAATVDPSTHCPHAAGAAPCDAPVDAGPTDGMSGMD